MLILYLLFHVFSWGRAVGATVGTYIIVEYYIWPLHINCRHGLCIRTINFTCSLLTRDTPFSYLGHIFIVFNVSTPPVLNRNTMSVLAGKIWDNRPDNMHRLF